VKKRNALHSLPADIETRFTNIFQHIPSNYIFVSIPEQTLTLICNKTLRTSYPVSSSRFGTGNRAGSFQTPQGIHIIAEKIGDGVPPGRIFRDRNDTGENWVQGMESENCILTRILRLRGCEDGINRGEGIDSYDRYIYIHGTNNEHLVGTPMSHGCICMKNADSIDLYDRVWEGMFVVID
jgi:lipoprotein-anchoring transpeptidase ErfK/SrfK